MVPRLNSSQFSGPPLGSRLPQILVDVLLLWAVTRDLPAPAGRVDRAGGLAGLRWGLGPAPRRLLALELPFCAAVGESAVCVMAAYLYSPSIGGPADAFPLGDVRAPRFDLHVDRG